MASAVISAVWSLNTAQTLILVFHCVVFLLRAYDYHSRDWEKFLLIDPRKNYSTLRCHLPNVIPVYPRNLTLSSTKHTWIDGLSRSATLSAQ